MLVSEGKESVAISGIYAKSRFLLMIHSLAWLLVSTSSKFLRLITSAFISKVKSLSSTGLGLESASMLLL